MRNLYEHARLYAESEKSDPFAYRRAITHIRTGIATHFAHDGKDGFYTAEEAVEERETMLGVKYNAVVYRNVARP